MSVTRVHTYVNFTFDSYLSHISNKKIQPCIEQTNSTLNVADIFAAMFSLYASIKCGEYLLFIVIVVDHLYIFKGLKFIFFENKNQINENINETIASHLKELIILYLCYIILVNCEANIRRINMVESCFGSAGQVGVEYIHF